MNFWRYLKTAILAFSIALPLAAAAADAHIPDHDEVRAAVEHGEIRSLDEILSDVRMKLPGEIVGVEIEKKNGHWIYEFRTADGSGRLFEVHVDARTGKIERIKEK